ncbi:MAG: hypothetical protein CTY16_06515 [Methylobacter sp.]|uniref:hypothetical protein n=1 Tax=Methylovulum miyakonense TaxID=645578 RepID=UPI00035DE5A6|nr:hypothetical protein [Methylovulum miyakonense]PPD47871.1 MAG: hypothetical protein CTY16_06515 [Methylobacter sp.]
MIEIIALCLLTLAVTACFFSFFPEANVAKLQVPKDSMLRRHFLTHLRHENPALAAKLEKQLAKAK